MSDCTWLNITVPDCVVKLMADDLGWESDVNDSKNGVANLQFYEANYGGDGLLNKLEEQGIPYHGVHGTGGGYAPNRFAYDGDKAVSIISDEEGSAMIHVGPTGVNEKDLKCAKSFFKTEALAEKAVKEFRDLPAKPKEPIEIPLTG